MPSVSRPTAMPPVTARTLPPTSQDVKPTSKPEKSESSKPETPFDQAHPHVSQLEDQYQDLSKKQVKEYGIQDPKKLFEKTMNQMAQDWMQSLSSDDSEVETL